MTDQLSSPLESLPDSLPSQALDPFVVLAQRQELIYRAVTVFGRFTVALSDQVKAGFDRVTAQLVDLDADIDAALAAATTVNDQLATQIAALTQARDVLQAQVGADSAEIARLNDVITGLEQARATAESDLMTRLGSLSSSVDQIDADVPGGSATP